MKWDVEILPPLPLKNRQALGYNLFGQLVALLFGAITLDGGVLGAMVFIAFVGYWIAAGVILARRYTRMTGNDLLVFKWGFLVAMLLVLFLKAIAELTFIQR